MEKLYTLASHVPTKDFKGLQTAVVEADVRLFPDLV